MKRRVRLSLLRRRMAPLRIVRVSKRRLSLAVLMGVLAMLLFAVVSDAVNPTIEAASSGGAYGGYYWLPSSAQVSKGGEVNFRNASTTIPHGVVWTSGPETPSCPGVPLNKGETKWEGSCTFTHAGMYSFHCYVHPTEMTGSVTVLGTPTATTTAASEITQRSALGAGSVNPEGQSASYHFEYGTLSVNENSTSIQSVGASDFTSHSLSASLAGLEPNTEYRIELVVTYGSTGTVNGGERVFKTPPLEKPSVSTGAATNVTLEGATLNGSISPEGLESEYRFEYGLTTGYGSQTPVQHTAAEGGTHAVTASLSELAPGTYHFRLVASNSQGEAIPGEDHTFTTASVPPKEPPKEPPAKEPVPTPTPALTPAPTPSPGPVPPEPEIPPLVAPLVQGSLKLAAAPHHGAAVQGSLQVTQAGAGGRLEVDLIATSASLARRGHRSKQAIVGRLERSSVSAGKVSFSVALNASAKRALRRHHRLALTVKVVLTPKTGKAEQIAHSVVLRA